MEKLRKCIYCIYRDNTIWSSNFLQDVQFSDCNICKCGTISHGLWKICRAYSISTTISGISDKLLKSVRTAFYVNHAVPLKTEGEFHCRKPTLGHGSAKWHLISLDLLHELRQAVQNTNSY